MNHPRRNEPQNVFKDVVWDGMVKARGSLWAGTLEWLTILACSKLSCRFGHSLNVERVKTLYNKQLVGCKRRDGEVYTVDRYRFINWVRQNHTKLCITVAELKREQAEWDSVDDLKDFFDLDCEPDELEADEEVRVDDGDLITADDAGFYYGGN